ncbi:oligosaccharide flippase family protein [Cupriavidus oxalaticus]|uniref:oligosaccharide flippase family protein n=1 Tax=Cupriavidus oxalaticus TaxID=96344 RepID=UPI003170CF91
MHWRIASNVGWMLFDRCAQVIAGIGIVAILARTLGTDGFAAFQYAQSLVLIGASVALVCGGEVVVPRLVAVADAVAQHRLLAHVFRLRLLASCCGYLLVCSFLAISAHAHDSLQPALILGIAILLREPSGVVTAWTQAHTRTRPTVLISLVSLALKTGAVIALAAAGIHAVGAYATAFVLEPLLAAILLAAFYRGHMPRHAVAFDRQLARQLFRDGSLFWISFMMMMAARRVDQLILRPHVPSAEFASYAAAMQIVDNYTTLATILASGIAPLYVYSRDAAVGIRNVLKLAIFSTVVGAAGAAVLVLLAPWIVHLLYGAAFAEAGSLLRLTALASPLIFADVGFTVLAVYLRRPAWIAVKWGLALLATVAVDLALIPRYGALGAILGYTAGNALAMLTGLWMWRQARKLRGTIASGADVSSG